MRFLLIKALLLFTIALGSPGLSRAAPPPVTTYSVTTNVLTGSVTELLGIAALVCPHNLAEVELMYQRGKVTIKSNAIGSVYSVRIKRAGHVTIVEIFDLN